MQRYNGVPPFKETRNYVAKIQSLLSGLGLPMATTASPSMTSYAPSDNPFGVKAVAIPSKFVTEHTNHFRDDGLRDGYFKVAISSHAQQADRSTVELQSRNVSVGIEGNAQH